MEALRQDGLSDVAEEAQPLFSQQAEFVVLNGNRRFHWANDWWSAFAIALGSTALLGLGAWAVFRKKEL